MDDLRGVPLPVSTLWAGDSLVNRRTCTVDCGPVFEAKLTFLFFKLQENRLFFVIRDFNYLLHAAPRIRRDEFHIVLNGNTYDPKIVFLNSELSLRSKFSQTFH